MHKTPHKTRTNAQQGLAQNASLLREALCVRTNCASRAPDLLELLDAAKTRLGAKLNHLDTPTLTAGRRPWWWQQDWA